MFSPQLGSDTNHFEGTKEQLVRFTHELLNFSLSPHLTVIIKSNGYFGHNLTNYYILALYGKLLI